MPHSHAASSTAWACSSDIAVKRLPRLAPPKPSLLCTPTPPAPPAAIPRRGGTRSSIACHSVPGEGGGMHLGSGARFGRRPVPAAGHLDRRDEVLVEVIHVLDHATVDPPRHGHVVEHRQVLYRLAEPDAARMRTHR